MELFRKALQKALQRPVNEEADQAGPGIVRRDSAPESARNPAGEAGNPRRVKAKKLFKAVKKVRIEITEEKNKVSLEVESFFADFSVRKLRSTAGTDSVANTCPQALEGETRIYDWC
jgi:hypothetical protein